MVPDDLLRALLPKALAVAAVSGQASARRRLFAEFPDDAERLLAEVEQKRAARDGAKSKKGRSK